MSAGDRASNGRETTAGIVIALMSSPTGLTRRRLRCGLLVLHHHGWFEDMLFACPGLTLHCLTPEALAMREVHNPYHLDATDHVDVALVTTEWYLWLASRGDAELTRVMDRLRRSADAVVGYEGFDTFDLGLPPRGFDHLDLVIKAQGLYADRHRYNARQGAMYPRAPVDGGVLGSKDTYSDKQLEKLRLSVPCFLGVDRRVRARARAAKPDISASTARVRRVADRALETMIAAQTRLQRPTKLVHCVGALSHVSRMDVFRILEGAGVTGDHRVTSIPEHVFGTNQLDAAIPQSTRDAWETELRGLGVLHAQQSRVRYRLNMVAHRPSSLRPGMENSRFGRQKPGFLGAPSSVPTSRTRTRCFRSRTSET